MRTFPKMNMPIMALTKINALILWQIKFLKSDYSEMMALQGVGLNRRKQVGMSLKGFFWPRPPPAPLPCWLAARNWALVSSRSLHPAAEAQSNRASWLWTEASEAINSTNLSFPLSSDVFITEIRFNAVQWARLRYITKIIPTDRNGQKMIPFVNEYISHT